MPLAFFCTLFFRHRKKSVSAPWDGQSQSAPESARQAPPKGNFSRQSCRLSIQAGGFPRGKQSAWRALPCVPLVVCLNSGSLTAFGGCIHWIPASLRSPLHPFGSPTETIERPIGLQVLLPRRSRRVKPRQGEFLRQSCRRLLQAGWLSARPQSPSVATRSNRAPHRAASPLLAPTPARHPPPIQNGPRQEIPSPPGAVRMFCYPFTAPAITPDTMYFWHAR